MAGYSKAEINFFKRGIDITEYLKEVHPDEFIIRPDNMVSKDVNKRYLVIYPRDTKNPSHGYIHHKPKRPEDWKDNLDVLEILYNCSFMDACDMLDKYNRSKSSSSNPEVPHFNYFD